VAVVVPALSKQFFPQNVVITSISSCNTVASGLTKKWGLRINQSCTCIPEALQFQECSNRPSLVDSCHLHKYFYASLDNQKRKYTHFTKLAELCCPQCIVCPQLSAQKSSSYGRKGSLLECPVVLLLCHIVNGHPREQPVYSIIQLWCNYH
jgi:hypothetical protein